MFSSKSCGKTGNRRSKIPTNAFNVFRGDNYSLVGVHKGSYGSSNESQHDHLPREIKTAYGCTLSKCKMSCSNCLIVVESVEMRQNLGCSAKKVKPL